MFHNRLPHSDLNYKNKNASVWKQKLRVAPSRCLTRCSTQFHILSNQNNRNSTYYNPSIWKQKWKDI